MKNRKFKQPRLDTCVTVYAEDCNNNAEKMVRRFSKLVKKEGIIDECRERSHFIKPTTKRTEKKRAKKRLVEKINKKRDELFKVKDRVVKRRKR